MFNASSETGLVITLIIYLTFISLLGAGLGLTVDTIDNPNTGNGGFTVEGVTSIFGSFWNLVTFNVNGIPAVMNLLFIQPAIYGLIFLLMKAVIVNVIPFT